jgi:hypothetical protein
MKIADVAFQQMRASGASTIMYGDGLLADIGHDAKVRARHPLDRMISVLNALERDPRFEKMYIRGMDSAGRSRLVRGFRIKENING